MNIGLLRQLQVSDVGGVLPAWVVQLTALTQCLVVDGQGYCLHVHELVVGNGGLESKQQTEVILKYSSRVWRGSEYRLVSVHNCVFVIVLTERRV